MWFTRIVLNDVARLLVLKVAATGKEAVFVDGSDPEVAIDSVVRFTWTGLALALDRMSEHASMLETRAAG